jgi:hypothetical protein
LVERWRPEKQGTIDRLARLRQGEDFETLVAEFEGVPASAAVEAAAVIEMAAAVALEEEE